MNRTATQRHGSNAVKLIVVALTAGSIVIGGAWIATATDEVTGASSTTEAGVTTTPTTTTPTATASTTETPAHQAPAPSATTEEPKANPTTAPSATEAPTTPPSTTELPTTELPTTDDATPVSPSAKKPLGPAAATVTTSKNGNVITAKIDYANVVTGVAHHLTAQLMIAGVKANSEVKAVFVPAHATGSYTITFQVPNDASAGTPSVTLSVEDTTGHTKISLA